MARLSESSDRILSEDALKHIYKCEADGRNPTIEGVAGTLQISLDEAANLLTKMTEGHLLQMKAGTFSLTSAGRDYALQVIRAHRLWERYLADETGFTEAEWHDRAEQQEHALSPVEADALSAQLGHPTHDPHGDPIPTTEGEIMPHGGQPLTRMAVGQTAWIVHLEDEPEAVYTQLVAQGIHPGMEICLLENSSQQVRFGTDGETYRLPPMTASNISVVPIPKREFAPTVSTERLSALESGQAGKVVNISACCRGPERRRFMDLGILPGTVIKAELRSPGGDPTAYLIRGALIALRQEQANLINITRLEEAEA